MHAMYNIAFTATDVSSKVRTFLNALYWKYQVVAKLLNQVISKDFQLLI